jgi:coenzyme PQQ precursor peptide PqqA
MGWAGAWRSHSRRAYSTNERVPTDVPWPGAAMFPLRIPRFSCPSALYQGSTKEDEMAWTTPVLVEICIGLEINGYMPADGYEPPEF